MKIQNLPKLQRAVCLWPHFAGAVESRVLDAYQKLLAVGGGGLRRANVELNPRYPMQEPDYTPRESFWVGHAIAGQTFAEVFGLADIQHPFGVPAEEINSRGLSQRAEELRAEPFDEWLGRWK